MGKRKAADEAALQELEATLQTLVDAAERRAASALGEADRRRAVRDLHAARLRLRAWRRAGRREDSGATDADANERSEGSAA